MSQSELFPISKTVQSKRDTPSCGSTAELLAARQAYGLQQKIAITEMRIKEWYEYYSGFVYVSTSGGKDSTGVLNIARNLYPDIPAVHVDTGLEYPEITAFVKTLDNVIWLKPKMSFQRIIKKYGYPVVSKEQSCAISRYRSTKSYTQKKRRLRGWPNGQKGMISKKWQYLIRAPFKISDICCDIMKKAPLDGYARRTRRKPITGMMADEGRQRKMHYLKHGCNAFDTEKPISWPMAHWTDKDVWEYIRLYNLPYSKIYDMGESRTGCMACMFGVQMERGENRFQRMEKSHPKHWNAFIKGMGLGKVLDFMGINYRNEPRPDNNVTS